LGEANTEKTCDLLIVGAGIAGLAAALFAADRGVKTALVGSVSELNYASGLLDLLGVHPAAENRVWEDPAAALAQLADDEPKHPYARLTPGLIEQAFEEFTAFLAAAGLPYRIQKGRNTFIVTQLGGLKATYAAPRTMFTGVEARREKAPCLLVDMHRLRGYSARLIALNLEKEWPGLKTARIDPPWIQGEIYNEPLALSLEAPQRLAQLAELIAPHLRGQKAVGLPAVLGIRRTDRMHEELEDHLQAKVFEVPTMLPSVTGMRIREAAVAQLEKKGVDGLYHKRVSQVKQVAGGGFVFQVGEKEPEATIRARAAVLASGRFFGRGLHADHRRVTETVFGLPVAQPLKRAQWYHRNFFHGPGHAVNRAGVEVDQYFRPLSEGGGPAYENLFAAGSILAHQDWKRQKCGGGLALATAKAAVEAYIALMG
jgi:glycerol-3-phosphate dehydrogenase subunit B